MKKTIYILIVGGMGGVVLNNLILPALVRADFLNSGSLFSLLYRPAIQTLIKTEEKVVTIEPDFWKAVISKNQESIGFIQSFKDKSVLAQGSVAVLTSDGLLFTAPQFVPPQANLYQVFINNKIFKARVVLKNEAESLAFIKVDEVNLPVFDFASDVQLGQSVIILGKNLRVKEIVSFARLGIVSEADKKVFILDTAFSKDLNGAGAFNSKGEFLGIARSNLKNQIFVLQPEILIKTLNNYLKK